MQITDPSNLISSGSTPSTSSASPTAALTLTPTGSVDLSQLPIGQWGKATVLSLHTQTGVLLFGDQKITVSGKDIPPAGTTMMVRVAPTSQGPVLECQPPTSPTPGSTQSPLAASDSTTSNLAMVREIVSTHTPAATVSSAPAKLPVLSGTVPQIPPGQTVQATVVSSTATTAVLDIQGKSITVRTDQQLPPGLPLSVQVSTSGSQPALYVNPAATPQMGQPVTITDLAIGTRVVGQIIQQVAQNRFQVNVRGQILELETAQPLRQGDQLHMQVAQTVPHLAMRIIDSNHAPNSDTELLQSCPPPENSSGKTLEHLQQSLANWPAVSTNQSAPNTPLSIEQAAAAVQDRLQQLIPDLTSIDAKQVETLIRDGGQFYESKLFTTAESNPEQLVSIAGDDLKGLLMGLARQMQDPQAMMATLQPLAESAAQHLGQIEAQQVANCVAQSHQEAIVIDLPFYVGGQLCSGKLAINPDRPQDDSAQGEEQWPGYAVLFLLELPSIGPVRVDAHISQTSLQVRFYLDNPVALELLKRRLVDLREKFHVDGYDRVYLSAEPLNKISPQKRRRFAAIATGRPESVNLVDVLK